MKTNDECENCPIKSTVMQKKLEFILRIEVDDDDVRVGLYNLEDVFDVEEDNTEPQGAVLFPSGSTTYGMEYISTTTAEVSTITYVIPIEYGDPENE
jgi:hypothetical protein